MLFCILVLFGNSVDGQLKPIFIWNLYVVGRTKVPPNDLGHITKIATWPIYGKNTSDTFFSRISGGMGQLH